MIYKNGKNIISVYKGSTPITKIYKGLQVIWESFKKLITSGIPPLTLTNSTGVPLIDYKIYGNSKKQAILPDEYQQVEYIEATGTQYFEIDYIANEKTNSKGTFQITNTAKANFLFGSRVSASTIGCYGFNWGGGQPYKYYNTYYGNSNDGMTNTNIDDKKHTFEKIGNKLYIDGTLIHTRKDTDGTLAFETPTKMTIFACNTNGAIGLQTYSRLSDLSFNEGEGDLFGLISCYRKSDGKIGMYDVVNNYFHTNQGTGEFLKGADVPTPDNPLELNNVGDKTYNLIDYSDVDKTANGVTFERKADGSIVCNGTATADTIVEVGWADLKNGKRYRGTGCPTGGSTSTYRMFFNYLGADLGNGSSATLMTADQKTQIRIFVYNGYKCENLTFYPMLTEVPDTTTKYPYKKAGHETPVSMSGKNLLDKSQMHVINRNANGLQWVYNAEEKAYYANGTQQAQLSSYALMFDSSAINNKLIHGHRYILTGNSIPENVNTRYYVFGNRTRNEKNTYISSDMEASRFFDWENGDNLSLDLRVYSTDGVFREIKNAKFQPMIIDVTGLDNDTINKLTANFEEYITPIITPIYLNEPLCKMGEYTDYIDYENQKIIRAVGIKTFSGTENWELHKENNDNVVYRLDNVLTPMLNAPTSATYMTHFSLTDIYSTSSFLAGTYRFGFDQDKLTITSSRLYVASDKMTVAEFKAWLSENKPTIFYPLETPTEESVVLPEITTIKGTNIIDVETEIKPSNVEVTYKGK